MYTAGGQTSDRKMQNWNSTTEPTDHIGQKRRQIN